MKLLAELGSPSDVTYASKFQLTGFDLYLSNGKADNSQYPLLFLYKHIGLIANHPNKDLYNMRENTRRNLKRKGVTNMKTSFVDLISLLMNEEGK